jgi:hypothetical protein
VSRQIASSSHREEGTASVELVGAVPFLLLATLVAAQIGLAGHALWSAGLAARAGARAALPESLRDGAEVSDGDAVSVRVAIPRLLPGVPVLTVGAEAALEAGDG